MKVSIAYTVDFDNIPEEVNKFLRKAEASCKHNLGFNKVIQYMEEENYDLVLTEIGNVRAELANVDLCLSDCMSILGGYLQTKYAPVDPPVHGTTQAPTPTRSHPNPKIDLPPPDLEQQLKDLKETNPGLFPSAKKENK